jgi:hypothetical protein
VLFSALAFFALSIAFVLAAPFLGIIFALLYAAALVLLMPFYSLYKVFFQSHKAS